MRFRSMLMMTTVVSISAIFALGCHAVQASPGQYAQSQAHTRAPAQGHLKGQARSPVQSQNQRQVNDRVRELQQQYKDLLKHEYNPAKFHPKASEKPSFSRPGWLNHPRRRSRARHRYYRRRHSRRWRRRHGVSSRKWGRRRRAVRRRSHIRTRIYLGRTPHRGEHRSVGAVHKRKKRVNRSVGRRRERRKPGRSYRRGKKYKK